MIFYSAFQVLHVEEIRKWAQDKNPFFGNLLWDLGIINKAKTYGLLFRKTALITCLGMIKIRLMKFKSIIS